MTSFESYLKVVHGVKNNKNSLTDYNMKNGTRSSYIFHDAVLSKANPSSHELFIVYTHTRTK